MQTAEDGGAGDLGVRGGRVAGLPGVGFAAQAVDPDGVEGLGEAVKEGFVVDF